MYTRRPSLERMSGLATGMVEHLDGHLEVLPRSPRVADGPCALPERISAGLRLEPVQPDPTVEEHVSAGREVQRLRPARARFRGPAKRSRSARRTPRGVDRSERRGNARPVRRRRPAGNRRIRRPSRTVPGPDRWWAGNRHVRRRCRLQSFLTAVEASRAWTVCVVDRGDEQPPAGDNHAATACRPGRSSMPPSNFGRGRSLPSCGRSARSVVAVGGPVGGRLKGRAGGSASLT